MCDRFFLYKKKWDLEIRTFFAHLLFSKEQMCYCTFFEHFQRAAKCAITHLHIFKERQKVQSHKCSFKKSECAKMCERRSPIAVKKVQICTFFAQFYTFGHFKRAIVQSLFCAFSTNKCVIAHLHVFKEQNNVQSHIFKKQKNVRLHIFEEWKNVRSHIRTFSKSKNV